MIIISLGKVIVRVGGLKIGLAGGHHRSGKIDGSWYYFNSSCGYMVTSQYIDGYWIGANGVCQ